MQAQTRAQLRHHLPAVASARPGVLAVAVDPVRVSARPCSQERGLAVTSTSRCTEEEASAKEVSQTTIRRSKRKAPALFFRPLSSSIICKNAPKLLIFRPLKTEKFSFARQQPHAKPWCSPWDAAHPHWLREPVASAALGKSHFTCTAPIADALCTTSHSDFVRAGTNSSLQIKCFGW